MDRHMRRSCLYLCRRGTNPLHDLRQGPDYILTQFINIFIGSSYEICASFHAKKCKTVYDEEVCPCVRGLCSELIYLIC